MHLFLFFVIVMILIISTVKDKSNIIKLVIFQNVFALGKHVKMMTKVKPLTL